MDRRGHLGAKILVQLVALHLALLKVQREIEADACQRPEPVQLALLDRQTVPDLDVPEIDSRLVLMLVLVLVLVLGGRLGRATDSQLLVVMVHGGARLRLIPLPGKLHSFFPTSTFPPPSSRLTLSYLIRVVLSAGRGGRGRWRESLVRGGRGGRADPALGRVGPLDRARARVLLLQRPGHVESHVALAPRRRPLPPRRPVLLPPPGLILVVRVLAFVDHAQPISLLDERFLVVVRQQPTVKRAERNVDQIGRGERKRKRERSARSVRDDGISPGRGSHERRGARRTARRYARGRGDGTRTFPSPYTRDTRLEESKWEVWLVFLAAYRVLRARVSRTRARAHRFTPSRLGIASRLPSRPVPSRLVALLFNSSCLCSHWGS